MLALIQASANSKKVMEDPTEDQPNPKSPCSFGGHVSMKDLRISRSAEVELDHLARAHCGNLYVSIVSMEWLHLDLPSLFSIF